MNSLRLFLLRCARIMVAPGQETEQIVLNRHRLGGWLLNWFVSALGTRWVGEALWPGWDSLGGILAIALAAAIPLFLIQATVIHITGKLIGGRGRWDVKVALGGYANVPFVALALLFGGASAMYVRVFGAIRFHLAFVLLFFLALLIIIITGLVISRHGLTANYGLSARCAWLITILGSLVFLMGDRALRMPYTARGSITSANLAAMSQIPAPPVVTAEGAVRHLAFEYTANLQYYHKLAIRRGDIVMFRDLYQHCRIGRILGLPGESAGLQNGYLVVNGALLTESWHTGGDLTLQPWQLGSDEFFIYTDERRTDPVAGLLFPAIAKKDQILGPVLRTDLALMRFLFGQSPLASNLKSLP